LAVDTGAPVTQIGKYQILGILGVGGMGVVYRGMDNSVGREVAIKTLTEATDELRQRFQLEARSGVLNHPNIVTIYDFGEQDGNPYIVMEFVQGDSLENLLRAGRHFSLIEKLDIVRQVCLGLGYAHQKGVVHRDIKPANIMVQPDGNIKIVDFGIARLESHSGQTKAGMVIGTFHYISPERLLGKTADGRADIWSVGIILYQLLTGRLPFPGDDPATLHRVIREPHESLSSMQTDCPPALDHLLNRALAKDPIDRYETAEEMAADVEAVNDELKREHVGEVLGNVKHLIEQEQWTTVKPVLLDLQRLNPQNTEVKRLLREVQEKASRQQKTVQIQQVLGEAEEAVLSQRYAAALEFYKQAEGLGLAIPELAQKIEHVRGLKEKADKVASLLEQSRDARRRGNFGAASELVEKALQIDDHNTDLRNERARIVQEAERATRERARREFSDAARGQLAARQFTEAIKSLRSALEIDPTDAETQQLYQDAVERQEAERRRKIIDQIVAEISECIAAEEYARALALIQRAQERLPGEAVLLQLKSDAETGQREQAAKKLVEKTSLEFYSVYQTNPQQALAVVQQALEEMPGEPRLIALKEKVVELIRKAGTEEQKAQYLKRAQASIDAKQYDQAIQILESAAIEYGESPDIASLLNYARENQRRVELSLAAANATRAAQALIAAGQFEAAIALLEPVAAQTGDASVQQLLRQASSSLAELVRRIDAVVSRAQALSERDVDQALQLLSSQPQDIQQHSRVRELRARLEAAKVNASAAQQAGAAIPIQQAPIAQVAIRQEMPGPGPSKPKRGLLVPLLIAVIVVIVLAGGAAYWFLRPAPAAPMGVLELNATPFAEVVSVTSDKGKAIPLPAGDHWTPLRLDEIPVGRYTVGFKGPDGTTRTQQCDVAQTAQVCDIEFTPIDDTAIQEIMGGAK
jgi:serine/threonine-protein kinase